MMNFTIQEYGLADLCNEATSLPLMHSEGCTVIRLENEIDTDLNIRVDTVRFTQALLSALTYPQKYKEKREIDFKVTLDTEKNFINFRITNSPLADERFPVFL